MSNIRGFHTLDIQAPSASSDNNARGGYVPPWAGQTNNNTPQAISMMQGRVEEGKQLAPFCERIFPHKDWLTATAFISMLELIMFIVTLIVGAAKFDGAFVSDNKMVGPSPTTLKWMGGKYEPDIRDHGEVWLLITPILLHAGIFHIAGNLFFQLRIGFVLEKRWTIWKFVLIYFISGIGASLFSCILSPESISVGASGALFGLFGSDIAYVLLNWRDIPHVRMEACFIGVVVIMNFLFGLGGGSDGHVDNWAHFGGLLTGVLFSVAILDLVTPRDKGTWIRVGFGVLTVALFVLLICLLWVEDPSKNV